MLWQAFWRMLWRAMLASRLFVLCCGLISIGHGFSFMCFGRVLKGLLVFGTAVRITLPLELFEGQTGLFRPIDRIGWLLAGQICLWKCILGRESRFAIDLLYFMCNSTFGLNGFSSYFMLAWIVLFGLLLCMDMSMLRAARKYVGVYLGT